jgi:hypothetical protein
MGRAKNRKGKNSERALAAKNSDMKINCQNSNDACRLKSRFVIVSIFETNSFPVRVQNLRLAQTKLSKISSQIIRLKRPEIATPAARKNEPN